MAQVEFKAKIPAKAKRYEITVGAEKNMLVQSFTVKESTDDFFIVRLMIGAQVMIGAHEERIPATLFGEDAIRDVRALPATVLFRHPVMTASLLVDNDADTDREFTAILEGRTE